MATSLAQNNDDYKDTTAVFTDTAGGGTALAMKVSKASQISVQRLSGSGTYTITGSLDGVKYGALPTALAAVNDDLPKIVTGNPRFILIAVASAAATIGIYVNRA